MKVLNQIRMFALDRGQLVEMRGEQTKALNRRANVVRNSPGQTEPIVRGLDAIVQCRCSHVHRLLLPFRVLTRR